MPDVHSGIGATVGSVIPTEGAIIPAAVGVDIGCGMMAVATTLRAARPARTTSRACARRSSAAVPHGRTDRGAATGARGATPPARAVRGLGRLAAGLRRDRREAPEARRSANHVEHLGTLGTGNHFIEVCLDEAERVWFMLHSGSRGVGTGSARYFIELAKADMRRWFINLPDQDLAYLPEGTEHFDDYVEAVDWAQDFALTNRELMMDAIVAARCAACRCCRRSRRRRRR